MTKKRVTKERTRPTTRRVHSSIRQIIGMLERRHERGSLCPAGVERLQWWRAHGHRYKNARHAILSWRDADIRAYAEYLGIDITRYRRRQALEDLHLVLSSLSHDDPLRRLIARVEQAIKASLREPMRVVARQMKVNQWVLPENRW